MRKIEKTNILSVKYKEWVDKLNHDEVEHPHRSAYYDDVVMNLLLCQKGVCAYTEMLLCHPGPLKANQWKNGRYAHKSPETIGELDHFDPQLKKNKYWEWQNLFVVLERINRRKGAKEVDDILKPDSPGYDPTALLEYNEKRNIFIPHTGIEDEAVRARIQYMIDVLHINFDFVKGARGRFLKKVFKSRDMDQPVDIDCFFTAYQMALSAKGKKE